MTKPLGFRSSTGKELNHSETVELVPKESRKKKLGFHEQEILDFLKSFYKGEILINVKNILPRWTGTGFLCSG